MTFLENVDKAKLQKILLITISALMLAALALLLAIVIMSIEPAGLKEANIDFTDYTLEAKDVKTGTLILADADHPYTPNEELLDLTKCADYMRKQPDYVAEDNKDYDNMNYVPWTDMRLPTFVMQNLHPMLTDAKKAVGEGPVTIDAAYDMVQAGAEPNPEYATGLLVLLSDSTSDYYERVELSEAYRKWFDENASKYGFVKSFEDAYRYVGVEHAKYMADQKLTLADYIAYLKENTNHEKGLQLTGADGETYYVYYVTAKSGESIKVPAEGDYTISGTNEGGVIVTVKNSK